MPLQSLKAVNHLQPNDPQYKEQAGEAEVEPPPKLIISVLVEHWARDICDNHAESLKQLIEGAKFANHRRRSNGVDIDGNDGGGDANDES